MRIAGDGDVTLEPCGVYRLYNESGALLYVGMSNNVPKRLVQQARAQSWWPEVASHTAEAYPDRSDAAAAERHAIETEDPKYNIRQHEINAIRARNDRARRPRYVYRAYSPQGALLYVGMTLDPSRRLADHGDSTRWWGEVKTIKVEQLPNLEAAQTAERLAIKREHPRYNVVHGGWPGEA